MGKVVSFSRASRSSLPEPIRNEIIERWAVRRQDTYDIAKAMGLKEAAVYNCLAEAKHSLAAQRSR